MPRFQRRPLALFVCCAFAGAPAAHAADSDQSPAAETDEQARLYGSVGVGRLRFAAADEQQPMRLRMERKFDILAPKPATTLPSMPGIQLPSAPKQKESRPVFIIADRLSGRTEEVTEAAGDAELRRYGSRLFADRLTYRPLEDEVDAVGNVRLQQNEDEISGPHLRMKLTDQVGFFETPDYKLKKEVLSKFYVPVEALTTMVSITTSTSSAPLMLMVPKGYGLPTTVPPRRPSESYGHSERMDFEGENRMRMTNATYSTCKPDSQDWYLKADEIRLDYDHEVGDAKNATLVFEDVPIFYTPFGFFSLNQRRKSGFLAGSFAASTLNGVDITLPYYWNLAPNYDVTFYPREMSKRGIQLGADAEYVDYNYQGYTRFEYLPNDLVEHRSRYAYNVLHSQNLGRGFSTSINWNGVSDDTYWQDFSSRLLQTSQVQLPQQLVLNYAPGSWWSANLQTLRYQTLSPDPANPVARPYFIEPQLNFSGRLSNIYKTDFSVLGQYTKFVHPTLTEGERVVIYPQLSLPYVSPAFMAMPKIGLHATQYALDRRDSVGDPNSISRVLPTFSFDSTVFFERETQWLDSRYVQTLEPRLYYVYIPYRNQDKIPVFDTGIADFNFAQIFSENRYTGFDRINDANQLTTAVTTRFLDASSGAELFKAMIGQRYYFHQQQVTLPGENARLDNFSNFLAAFNGAVLPKTYVDGALEYDYHHSQTERFSLGARYQPDLAKVISASYRINREVFAVPGQIVDLGQIEQFDIAGQWPIASRWYAVGRYNYSLRDKQLLEAIAGVEYNTGCWTGRFVLQRLEALAGSPNTTFFFQLELKDFASVGSNPIQLLRRTIPGYGKVNELPTTGSLLTTQ